MFPKERKYTSCKEGEIMIEPKYKIGDILFSINDYKIAKVRVDEIDIKIGKKESVTYQCASLQWETVGKTKIKPFSEAYLVESFEVAKQSALANLETITQSVRRMLTNIKEEDMIIVPEEAK